MGTSDSPGQKPLLKRQKTSMSSSSSTGSPHHPSTFLRTPSSSSLTSKKAKARLVKRPSSSVIPISLFRADPTTSDPEDAHAKNAEFGGFSDLGMDDCSMPRSPRPSTYSSLPPSPRLQAALDLGIDPLETLTLDKRGLTDVDNLSSGRRGQVGLGIGPDDLGRALGGLVDKGEGKGYKEKDRSTGLLSAGHVRSESDLQTLGDGPKDKKGRRRTGSEESDESFGAGSAGSEHGDTEVDEVEEEFWPARSRRPTLESRGSGRYGRGGPPGLDGMNGMNGMGQSPPYAVNERGPSSPTSPKSPTSATHWTASSGDESKADGGDVAELTVGGIAGLWDILTDEAGEEAWDGWVADGKWCVFGSSLPYHGGTLHQGTDRKLPGGPARRREDYPLRRFALPRRIPVQLHGPPPPGHVRPVSLCQAFPAQSTARAPPAQPHPFDPAPAACADSNCGVASGHGR